MAAQVPPAEPYDRGLLDVGDGNLVYWETRGTGGGKPALVVHGGSRLCAHYFSHGAWLEEGELLRDAHRLAGIPGVLIHGRLDLGSPLGRRGSLPARGPTRSWS